MDGCYGKKKVAGRADRKFRHAGTGQKKHVRKAVSEECGVQQGGVVGHSTPEKAQGKGPKTSAGLEF